MIEIRNQWLVFFFLWALLVVTACSTQPSAQSNEPLMNIFTPLPTVKTNYLPTSGVTTATRLSTKFPTEISTPLPISQTATAPSLAPTTTESATPPLTPTFPAENHLKGPLMAFRMDDTEGFFISLLDIGSGTIRNIRTELVDYPLELQWFADGCLLFVRGRLIDLTGNEVWAVPLIYERGWNLWSFGDSRLSPDKNWLVVPNFSGYMTYDSAEFVDLEIADLSRMATPIALTSNGGAHASATWSSDGKWVAFSDYDDQGHAQLFRSSFDGRSIEQLTFHASPVLGIGSIVWSADNTQIAFAGAEESSSWVGVLNVNTHEIIRIEPEKFWSVRKIWWSPDGTRLVFTGESLSNLDRSDPFYGSRIHWVDVTKGTISNSFYEKDAPSKEFSIPHAVGDIDSIFFTSRDGYYMLSGTNNSYQFLGNFDLGGLFWGVESSPFIFPGEENCTHE